VRLAVIVLSALLGLAAGAASASGPSLPPGHGDDPDCRACHVDRHQSVKRLFTGTGGRGAAGAPDRMFQVGIQCVACHKTPAGDAVAGRTFKATDVACKECHGDRYRGMLPAWREGFAKLREITAAKIAAGRAALGKTGPGSTGRGRAAKLLEDADHNARLVGVANGAHNVFYAARLLDVAGRWADDAARAAGGPPAKVDDALARGGYCAALCHATDGMKPLRETVTFQKRTPLPHLRHVAELGATCTTCHSGDRHKALAATPATCTGCHHAPQNERCENCHKPQSAFYRGTLTTTLAKLEPNSMANAVGCIGCHDMSKKHTRAAVAEKCTACHDKSYDAFTSEWTTGLDAEIKKTADAVAAADADVAKARRGGAKTAEADALLKDAHQALALVRRARGAHNPAGADALLGIARDRAAGARQRVTAR
jgi:hypothetical protein